LDPTQTSQSSQGTSSSSGTTSSSSEKKKSKKKSKTNGKKQKRGKSSKSKKSGSAKKLKRKAALKLQKKKDEEKRKKAEEAKRKLDKANAEKLAKQNASKAAKYKQDAVKVLAKVNPLAFSLEKALGHHLISAVASFAVDACKVSLDELQTLKKNASAVSSKPDVSVELPWNRDQVNSVCKDAAQNLGTLNGMFKAAQAFAART
jgi:hypothetical protein